MIKDFPAHSDHERFRITPEKRIFELAGEGNAGNDSLGYGCEVKGKKPERPNINTASAGFPAGESGLIQEEHIDAAPGQFVSESRSGRPSADDENFGF